MRALLRCVSKSLHPSENDGSALTTDSSRVYGNLGTGAREFGNDVSVGMKPEIDVVGPENVVEVSDRSEVICTTLVGVVGWSNTDVADKNAEASGA
jgi:hypothetical protein